MEEYQKRAQKKYRQSDHGKLVIQRKERRYRDRHQVEIKATKAAWRSANPEKVKAGHQRYNIRRHGITLDRYATMMEEQKGLCALCGNPFADNDRPSIDHDHSCCPSQFGCAKCVRAIIHQKCNRAIGQLNDDPDLVMKAYQYLITAKETAMSSFRQQKTQINDVKCLEEALKGLGYKPNVSATKQDVRGHYNENRKAEVILKKEDLKEGGDVGFNKTKDGNFEIVTDTYVMRSGFNLDKFTKAVTQKYAEVKLRKQASSAGLTFLKRIELPTGGFRMQFVQA